MIQIFWEQTVSSETASPSRLVLRAALRGASFGYGLAVRFINALYDSNILRPQKLPVTVISIGNLTLGGTGKTALSIWCANRIREQGRHPAILSRGYARKGTMSRVHVVSDGTAIRKDVRECGDEPALMARACPGVPVAVSSDRATAGQTVLKQCAADCFLLDDGFQHRKLSRDGDIVCLDENLLRAPHLFPRGWMREPIDSLSRADFVLVKSARNPEEYWRDFERIFSRKPKCETAFFHYETSGFTDHVTEESFPSGWLSQRRASLFSGIAHPSEFEQMARALGGDVRSIARFADHYFYSAEDLDRLAASAKANDSTLVTTEKDAVKLPKQFPCVAMQVQIVWQTGHAVFDGFIEKCLRA